MAKPAVGVVPPLSTEEQLQMVGDTHILGSDELLLKGDGRGGHRQEKFSYSPVFTHKQQT